MQEIQRPTIKIFGVRGSIAAADQKFMVYGGNTSSYTLRTPSNSLVFLDAGIGILNALNELNNPAERVYLALSHTHADHVQGLAMPNEEGMEALPWLSKNIGYEGKKAKLIGPKGILEGLRQYYDAKHVWPVPPEWMPDIDFKEIIEAQNDTKYPIDETTTLRTIYGNHPVANGVILFRFEMVHGGKTKTFVFATDHEFDFMGPNKPHPQAEELKRQYVEFIDSADLLIADAQYDTHQYYTGSPKDVRGFGHSYARQIIDLAKKGKVKKLVLTHHDRRDDNSMRELEEWVQDYAGNDGIEAVVAKERTKFKL